MSDFDPKEMLAYLDYYYELTSYEYADYLRSIKPFAFDSNNEVRKKIEMYKNILNGIQKILPIIDRAKYLAEQEEKEKLLRSDTV